MMQLRLSMLFPLISLTFLILNCSYADAESPKRLALLPGAHRPIKEAVSPARWFAMFDAIDQQTRLNEAERNRGALLMMRALAGVGHSDEDAMADHMLHRLADKYNCAAQQVERLPKIKETEPLQDGYMDYFRGTAKLCEDCAALKAVDPAKKVFRRLTPEETQLLLKRKKMLDELIGTCRWADSMTRVRYKCYRPTEQEADDDRAY